LPLVADFPIIPVSGRWARLKSTHTRIYRTPGRLFRRRPNKTRKQHNSYKQIPESKSKTLPREQVAFQLVRFLLTHYNTRQIKLPTQRGTKRGDGQVQSMYEQDWIMRQIKLMTAAIAKIVFGKDVAMYEMQDEAGQTETDKLHLYLLRLIDEGKINEAEDLLFESLSSTDNDSLLLAVDFYQRLNALGNDELKLGNFSRQEIYDGLREVESIYRLDL
jgi:hypothetical protein